MSAQLPRCPEAPGPVLLIQNNYDSPQVVVLSVGLSNSR